MVHNVQKQLELTRQGTGRLGVAVAAQSPFPTLNCSLPQVRLLCPQAMWVLGCWLVKVLRLSLQLQSDDMSPVCKFKLVPRCSCQWLLEVWHSFGCGAVWGCGWRGCEVGGCLRVWHCHRHRMWEPYETLLVAAACERVFVSAHVDCSQDSTLATRVDLQSGLHMHSGATTVCTSQLSIACMWLVHFGVFVVPMSTNSLSGCVALHCTLVCIM